MKQYNTEYFFIDTIMKGYKLEDPIKISNKIKEILDINISPLLVSTFLNKEHIEIKNPFSISIKNIFDTTLEQTECPICIGQGTVIKFGKESECSLCNGTKKVTQETYDNYIEDNYNYFIEECRI